MNNMVTKFRMNMAAAAFAEMAEWDTARQLAPGRELREKITWWDRIFLAVTFAEHGLREDAAAGNGCIGKKLAHCGDDLRELGLQGVHMTFGIIQVEAEC
jgi:hypothetical protein